MKHISDQIAQTQRMMQFTNEIANPYEEEEEYEDEEDEEEEEIEQVSIKEEISQTQKSGVARDKSRKNKDLEEVTEEKEPETSPKRQDQTIEPPSEESSPTYNPKSMVESNTSDEGRDSEEDDTLNDRFSAGSNNVQKEEDDSSPMLIEQVIEVNVDLKEPESAKLRPSEPIEVSQPSTMSKIHSVDEKPQVKQESPTPDIAKV